MEGEGDGYSGSSPIARAPTTTRDDVKLIDDDRNTAHSLNAGIRKPGADGTRRTLLILGIVCVFLLIIGVVGAVAYSITNEFLSRPEQIHAATVNRTCSDPCLLTLVESIPDNLTYAHSSLSHLSTYAGIHQMLTSAMETIEIASFYWTMTGQDIPTNDSSAWAGKSLYQDLLDAGSKKGIKIRIVQNANDKPVIDTINLMKQAHAEVRSLNLTRLIGNGIIHTKMWLIDRQHFYVGSANLDWRSFTQVKELGAVIRQCPCMAQDLGKIFDAYWYLAEPDSKVPATWPASYNTDYNASMPVNIQFNGTNVTSYLSSSPPPLCAEGRTGDIDAITDTMSSATQFIYVAVMDYFPTTQFTHPRIYWPVIDDALRAAAFNRQVKVKLLASSWSHSWKDMILYLKSLDDLHHFHQPNIDIQVKMFVVPAYTDAQKHIPYSRVNHNKYMVTDQTAYIGTSNWSGDYFINTAGVGLIVNQPKTGNHSNSAEDVDIRQQLEDIFLRDWYSEHAFFLDHFNTTSY